MSHDSPRGGGTYYSADGKFSFSYGHVHFHVKKRARRLYNFQKRISEDNPEHPLWLKDWIRYRKNGVDYQKLIKLNRPFTDDPRPFPGGKRYDKPSDYRPRPEVTFDLEVRLSQSATKIIKVPLDIIPKYFFEEKILSSQEIENYFKSHGSYIKIQAVQLFQKYRANVLNRIHIYATFVFDAKQNKIHTSKRCEDIESLLWEFVLAGKGINKKALYWQFGAWVKDKTALFRKYGIDDTISLPHDQLDKFDLDRMGKGWKMSIPFPLSDGPTFEEWLFNKATSGFRKK